MHTGSFVYFVRPFIDVIKLKIKTDLLYQFTNVISGRHVYWANPLKNPVLTLKNTHAYHIMRHTTSINNYIL